MTNEWEKKKKDSKSERLFKQQLKYSHDIEVKSETSEMSHSSYRAFRISIKDNNC